MLNRGGGAERGGSLSPSEGEAGKDRRKRSAQAVSALRPPTPHTKDGTATSGGKPAASRFAFGYMLGSGN
jgi:hypothetical protein